tara:strand:- start:2686 stop:3525 length:840 start_codon:yes stop_codon:yes gene_type:complete
MRIELEDNYEDVLMKAATGLGLGKSKLAELAGLSTQQVTSLLKGNFDSLSSYKVAAVLGLHPEAVQALASGESTPELIELEDLHIFNTSFSIPGFGQMAVNSFLVKCPKSSAAVLFDTGTDPEQVIAAIHSIGASLQAIFLTHTHRDHVASVSALRSAFSNATLYGPKREPFAGAYGVRDGDCFDVGSLQIKARLTNGHSKGGTSYLMDGLTKKIACVGDALFACSQGGVPAAQYAKSLEINRSQLLSLPSDTVLCPGHGPLTTVAHERGCNPFYAGIK